MFIICQALYMHYLFLPHNSVYKVDSVVLQIWKVMIKMIK